MGGCMDGWNADWLVYWMICLKVFSKQRIFQKPPSPFRLWYKNGAHCGVWDVLQVSLCRTGVSWTRTYWQEGPRAHLTAGRKPGF